MQKEFIQNRKGQKIAVLIEEAQNQKGLTFAMHGLGGFKEQVHIAAIAQAFLEKNYTVIRFDTTNTFGESDGNYENATITNYYEDLEDVISWAKDQVWYQEPFVLDGHSLGGICTALYAQKYPEKTKALAPISSVISRNLWFEVHTDEEMKDWEETKYRIRESKTLPGVVKKLGWGFVEDLNLKRYDLLKDADKLTMPVLLIVGELDETTPLAHQKILFDALPGKKELHIIKGAEHTFRDEEHLKEIKEIFLKWIDTIK
jgi:pimeloyl-ACP methyl ester carboxylesterase